MIVIGIVGGGSHSVDTHITLLVLLLTQWNTAPAVAKTEWTATKRSTVDKSATDVAANVWSSPTCRCRLRWERNTGPGARGWRTDRLAFGGPVVLLLLCHHQAESPLTHLHTLYSQYCTATHYHRADSSYTVQQCWQNGTRSLPQQQHCSFVVAVLVGTHRISCGCCCCCCCCSRPPWQERGWELMVVGGKFELRAPHHSIEQKEIEVLRSCVGPHLVLVVTMWFFFRSTILISNKSTESAFLRQWHIENFCSSGHMHIGTMTLGYDKWTYCKSMPKKEGITCKQNEDNRFLWTKSAQWYRSRF